MVSHHAVPEPISSHAEFERHEKVVSSRQKELVAVQNGFADYPGIANTRQEIFDDDPLIMFSQKSLCIVEGIPKIHDRVVRSQKRHMELGDN